MLAMFDAMMSDSGRRNEIDDDMDIDPKDVIRLKIARAARHRNKMGMFLYQVLKHAQLLDRSDALDFCRKVSVPEGYAVSFREMIALAELFAAKGEPWRGKA